MLTVSAAYTCRNYLRIDGRIEGNNGYFNEGTLCSTVGGYVNIESHHREYFTADIKECFSCNQANEQIVKSADVEIA